MTLFFSSCDIQKKTITIGFAGDVMLGRMVDEALKTRPSNFVWGTMLEQVKKPDITLINLESTFTKSENALPKVFNFKSDPKNVQVLIDGEIDVVTLANNHSFDFGNEGFFDTVRSLDAAGIKYVGAGGDDRRARKAITVEKNGIRVAFLGYTDNEPGWKAAPDRPGTNYITIGDRRDFKAIIDDLDQVRSDVDLIVVTLHWGPNMRQYPSDEFRQFAHDLIDAGVHIIHGHSAHIFQGVEVYKGGLIMYDTGDFVDDYHVDPTLRNDQSFFFEVEVGKRGPQKLAMTPIVINTMQVNLAMGYEAASIMQKMEGLCSKLGTLVVSDKNHLVINVKR